MATCPIEIAANARRRDLISELPIDVKEKILEWLPTRFAARTALLSPHWRDVWLGHRKLSFDSNFFCKCKGYSGVALVKIITYILLHRTRPVNNFLLQIPSCFDPKPEQSDLDQWCLFLSRNGVENLQLSSLDHKYQLPSSVFSCRTIKQLLLCSFGFNFPKNVRCIFPGVTALVFCHVDFTGNANRIVYSIPNLEKLIIYDCKGMSNFEISSPKLQILHVYGSRDVVESRWFKFHLKDIKILCLFTILSSGDFEVASTFPTAINLQVIKVCQLSLSVEKQLKIFLHLLQKSPNLCELEITAPNGPCSSDDVKAASRVLEDVDNCIINRDLEMLKIIKIETFSGSTFELLFVKMLLSKSPH